MRPAVLVAAIGVSAVLGGVIGGAAVRVMDKRDGTVTRKDLLFEVGALAQMILSDKKDARTPRPMGRTEQTFHMPSSGGDPDAGDGRWFCGDAICSRTLPGCVDIERRLVMESGPQPDGSACKRIRRAFCRLDGGSCTPSLRQCASEFSPCVGVE